VALQVYRGSVRCLSANGSSALVRPSTRMTCASSGAVEASAALRDVSQTGRRVR
jgi:hypothetical protein